MTLGLIQRAFSYITPDAHGVLMCMYVITGSSHNPAHITEPPTLYESLMAAGDLGGESRGGEGRKRALPEAGQAIHITSELLQTGAPHPFSLEKIGPAHRSNLSETLTLRSTATARA